MPRLYIVSERHTRETPEQKNIRQLGRDDRAARDRACAGARSIIRARASARAYVTRAATRARHRLGSEDATDARHCIPDLLWPHPRQWDGANPLAATAMPAIWTAVTSVRLLDGLHGILLSHAYTRNTQSGLLQDLVLTGWSPNVMQQPYSSKTRT